MSSAAEKSASLPKHPTSHRRDLLSLLSLPLFLSLLLPAPLPLKLKLKLKLI